MVLLMIGPYGQSIYLLYCIHYQQFAIGVVWLSVPPTMLVISAAEMR